MQWCQCYLQLALRNIFSSVVSLHHTLVHYVLLLVTVPSQSRAKIPGGEMKFPEHVPVGLMILQDREKAAGEEIAVNAW